MAQEFFAAARKDMGSHLPTLLEGNLELRGMSQRTERREVRYILIVAAETTDPKSSSSSS